MLQLKSVSKTYTSGGLIQTALNDVSISFRDNEFVSILGPSGSGKTTMLNIIGGLDRYDTGDLLINNVSTKKYKDRDWDSYRNHSIGFIFQSYNLIPHQTILSNVEMALTIAGVGKHERKKMAIDALDKVGLKEQAHKKPNQLSGGQMQRVAIARALINNPDILLADEPTGALDSATGVQVMELLKEVAKDKLVIMVTHNPELAYEYSTRIVEIKDGTVVSDSDEYVIDEENSEIEKPTKKVSMSRLTSLVLSFKNLLTKKGRTALTAFAGSIGIIGIALILAVSDGVNVYIAAMQKEAMSAYPISITSTTISDDLFEELQGTMQMAAPTQNNTGTFKKANGVFADFSATKAGDVILNNSLVENNLTGFKKYIEADKNISKYTGESGIVYSYDTVFDIFTHDENNKMINTDDKIKDSTSVLDSITSVYSEEAISTVTSLFSNFMPSSASNFSEMLPDKETGLASQTVKENYELLYGHWPESYDEIVLVLTGNSALTAEQMVQLGFLSNKKYSAAVKEIEAGNSPENIRFNYSDIINKEYLLMPACDYYRKTQSGYELVTDDEWVTSHSLKVKISGIIKPAKGAKNTTILTAAAYTKALTDYIIEHTENSEIVKLQKENPDTNVLTNTPFDIPDNEKLAAVKKYISGFTNEDKMSAMMSLVISGKIKFDMSNIDYSEFIPEFDMSGFEMPEIDINQISQDMMKDFMPKNNLTEEEKAVAFDEWLDKMSDEELMNLIGMFSGENEPEEETKPNEQEASVDKTKTENATEKQEETTNDKKLFGKWFGKISGEKEDTTETTKKNTTKQNKSQSNIEKFFGDFNDGIKAKTIRKFLKNMGSADKAKLYELTQYSEMFTDGSVVNIDTNNLIEKYMSEFQMPEMPEMPDFSDTSALAGMYFDKWVEGASEEELMGLYEEWLSENSYKGNLSKFGVVDKDTPSSISIFVDTFEAKDKIVDLIDKFNETADEENKIVYTDFISIVSSSFTSIINAITYVLIAFVAVSLFVSCIMISVITNISVMERTKEIGILRALGASKKNVVGIFNAETFIIGCLSGLIGVGITYASLIPINILADKLTHIDELRAVLKPEYAVILVLISIGITIIGGFVPAKKAAKCDPVIALRTE